MRCVKSQEQGSRVHVDVMIDSVLSDHVFADFTLSLSSRKTWFMPMAKQPVHIHILGISKNWACKYTFHPASTTPIL